MISRGCVRSRRAWGEIKTNGQNSDMLSLPENCKIDDNDRGCNYWMTMNGSQQTRKEIILQLEVQGKINSIQTTKPFIYRGILQLLKMLYFCCHFVFVTAL